MEQRIPTLIKKLASAGLDGLLLTDPYSISYLTRFRSRDSFLLVSREETVYLTDSRYIEDAARNLKGIAVKQFNPPLWKEVAGHIQRLKLKKVGFEEKKVSVASFRSLERFAKVVELVPAEGMVEELRQVKDKEELGLMRRACAINVKAMQFAATLVKPGIREVEIAGELERFIRYNGASRSAFEIIVASGPNTSLPHHMTSNRKVSDNEHLYIDMGVEYKGYTSDLTRVFFVGKIASLVKGIYKVAVEAQARAIACVRPGATARQVDGSCRSFIASRGFGRYFGHAAGHGVGLEVHEAPRISEKSDCRLREGMVFTVEPGIYIPGKFGVRIEDMVLVTRKGSEVLSGSLNK